MEPGKHRIISSIVITFLIFMSLPGTAKGVYDIGFKENDEFTYDVLLEFADGEQRATLSYGLRVIIFSIDRNETHGLIELRFDVINLLESDNFQNVVGISGYGYAIYNCDWDTWEQQFVSIIHFNSEDQTDIPHNYMIDFFFTCLSNPNKTLDQEGFSMEWNADGVLTRYSSTDHHLDLVRHLNVPYIAIGSGITIKESMNLRGAPFPTYIVIAVVVAGVSIMSVIILYSRSTALKRKGARSSNIYHPEFGD
nr:hypothetical protein [Candidatus Sigynarchaeota archaeon]